jgi:NAD(P)-dependent dehydrogenase (short-subunit alcohol dehydrogenase family)
MRAVVIGGSSGLGRCIGVGLAQRGAQVAFLARRKDRLDDAVLDAGGGAVAIQCDVTDEASCATAIRTAAGALGGIDTIVYATGIGPLGAIETIDATTWRKAFDTNVIGASIVTAAALPYLQQSAGVAMYLSSISASLTPAWPGLSAYVVSKAALDKLVDAWRAEHPDVAFTCIAVGDCAGGPGAGATEFANDWDVDAAMEYAPIWIERKYISGTMIDVDHLVGVIDGLARNGNTLTVPHIAITPRIPNA